MSHSLVIQRPEKTAEQLLLLFRGVGATAQHMAPLGRRLAAEFPNAYIVSVGGAQESDLGSGRQWFSVRRISEENRAARVAAAMPGFLGAVAEWQRAAQVGIEGTALIGISQGAIMALESTRERHSPTGRVISIAGRFAHAPQLPAHRVSFHLLHGKADPVIPCSHTELPAQQLVALGADVTADVIPFVGHEINADIEDFLGDRLKSHVPRRLRETAVQTVPDLAVARIRSQASVTANRPHKLGGERSGQGVNDKLSGTTRWA